MDAGGVAETRTDIALLVLPAVAMVLVYPLPEQVKRSFALTYTDPTLATAFTAHFVHLGGEHLVANLIAYLLVVGVTYQLARIQRALPQFRVLFVATLAAVPFALSGLNVALVRPRVGFGFSGVLAGFFGVLSLTLSGYVRRGIRVDLSREWDSLPYFADLSLIGVVLLWRAPGTWVVALTAGVVTVWYTGRLYASLSRTEPLWHDWVLRPGYAELGVLGGVLVLAFPIFAFLPTGGGDSSVVNFYAHFLGFSLTAIAGYLLPPVDDAETAVPTG
ncbi:rhomboid family intramembrane serine protease [Halobaculum rarum]|uniref:rhomboid family intramembrane serine protease n=1 Tax=Halobaculum rarum TaxID=3075122 RepID=UPI0032AF70DF